MLRRARAALRDEDVDPEWADRMHGNITKLLATDAARDTEVYDIDCRSTRCELSMGHASEAAAMAFQDKIASALGRLLPSVHFEYIELGGGATETIVHLATEAPGTAY